MPSLIDYGVASFFSLTVRLSSTDSASLSEPTHSSSSPSLLYMKYMVRGLDQILLVAAGQVVVSDN